MNRIASVQVPDFGRSETLPDLPLDEYRARLDAATGRMQRDSLDILIVYADREHSATLAFLTGFDPRFEEALLLLDTAGRRLLLVGNECLGYLPDPSLGLDVELFQELSLLGQQRDGSRPLAAILGDFGVGAGRNVGCVGWKYFEAGLVDDPDRAIEIPSYVVDALRALTGDRGSVRNATALFMNPDDGLRLTNSADQIARFEFAATRTSESVLDVVRHLEPGTSEADLARLMRGDVLPQSCHPMLSFGEKARRGLSSPSHLRAARGDTYTTAFGIWGALTCRAGVVGNRRDDLPDGVADFYPAYVANYFDAVVAWYRTVTVGAVAGDVFAAVEAARDASLWHRAVNPGHYIHLDEWMHSPFTPGSQTVLRSGVALQMDIIPVSNGPFCYANVEDGIVLADDALRAELAGRHPAAWKRIDARRTFMTDALGIALDVSVLPLSNMPAWLPPYALDLDHALVASR
ncbi:MAG: hypothetical protein QF463_03560 [Vicinamibacterales bacterium]|nr:hypothetical protein [Vicinamibacterales bacterium]